MTIVCIHLFVTPEIPCVEIIRHPMAHDDNGRSYYCAACLARIDVLVASNIRVISEHQVDAMTVDYTTDVRRLTPTPPAE